jgi:hypothetical protein
MIIFQRPVMIGPLDAATPARRPTKPFSWWERYDFMIVERKLPVDMALPGGTN